MPTRAEASIALTCVQNGTKQMKAAALMNIGYSKGAAYKIIKAAETNGDISDKRQSNGSIPKISGPSLGGLVTSFNNKPGKSLRKTAKTFNVCHKTISNTLSRAGVKCMKRKKAPFYKTNQLPVIRKTLGKLYHDHLLSSCRCPPKVIMDDETYVTTNDCVKFGNSRYYSKDPGVAPDHVKYAGVSKYPMKIGLWFAVSDCGISDWFIWHQGFAINADVYKKQCIQRRLIPFISENNLQNSSIFWPDKASAHYARSVQNYLTSKQVRFVPKCANPTNVPQCRPIEIMNAEIKRRVFLDNFYPKNIEEFHSRVNQVMEDLKKDGGSFTEGFSLRVRKLVRCAYRNGVLSVHK